MSFSKIDNQKKAILIEILNILIQKNPQSFQEAEQIKNEICGKYGISTISNIDIVRVANKENIKLSDKLKKILQKRGVRTASGVTPLTVLTKPFSCPGQCVFCPQEIASSSGQTLFEKDLKDTSKSENVPKKYKNPGVDVMPKSYFSNEPAASRALLASFDPFNQVQTRLKSLELTGHDTSKVELIILGGTFSAIPKRYRTWFTRRALQALNGDNYKDKTTLQKAQKKNENAPHRAIAIVIETRPDFISVDEIKYFRKLGCTKVELGVQSLDDEVLKTCKRGHGTRESINAIKLLKDAGFKLGIHMMPGLPGSNLKKDFECFKELFASDHFKPDFLKIYPCTVVPFSELEKWQKEGDYKALTEKELTPLLINIKKITPEYVRISRLVRDIPATSITYGSKTTNLRQLIQEKMKKENMSCKCIRCREVKDEKFNAEKIVYQERRFLASGGEEYFLSFNTESDKLVALLRLRIPSSYFNKKEKAIFSELKNSAIIRELHTYGTVVPVGKKDDKKAQHIGLGKELVKKAEEIVQSKYNLKKIAVISGIGVKDFWRKIGYKDNKYYLIKNI